MMVRRVECRQRDDRMIVLDPLEGFNDFRRNIVKEFVAGDVLDLLHGRPITRPLVGNYMVLGMATAMIRVFSSTRLTSSPFD